MRAKVKIKTPRASSALSATPIYQRIEADLRTKIRDGVWPGGMLLPGRRELAKSYEVQLSTLQRAIATLLADGTLQANGWRGTFVAKGIATNAEVPTQPETAAPPAMNSQILRAAPVQLTFPRTQATVRTLGIVIKTWPQANRIADLPDGWVRPILVALDRAFGEIGGTIRIFNRGVQGQADITEPAAIASLVEDGVGALAIVLSDEPPNAIGNILGLLGGAHIPVVFVTDEPLDCPVPHIFYDQCTAGYQAAQHLIRCGHRHLLFLAPFLGRWVEERIAGAAKAVEHAGLPAEALQLYPASSVRHPDIREAEAHFEEIGYESAKAALEAGLMDHAGVIAANDLVAVGAMKAAAEVGKVAGEDFGLLGFDDTTEARQRHLTSLRPPLEAMGEQAAQLLINALQGKETAIQVRLRSRLMPRASTVSVAPAHVSYAKHEVPSIFRAVTYG